MAHHPGIRALSLSYRPMRIVSMAMLAFGMTACFCVNGVRASEAAERLVRPGQSNTATAAKASAADPEARLHAVYAALANGEQTRALDLAAALVQDLPRFSLGQLLYGDLLATRAGHPGSFGHYALAALAIPDSDAESRRLGLREEAMKRLAARRDPPPEGLLPAELVRLPPGVRHVITVDVSRSRLYLFVNEPQGLRLKRHFYVSIGKQGFAKRIEGDQRTPLGIYWITEAVARSRLDDRFGHAALRINYPNALDRHAGRTGSGLYLHGVPAAVLAHTPRATDGCVAMANHDVTQLLQTLDVDATPVVIVESVHWVTPATLRETQADFRAAHESWDRARRLADREALAVWYESAAAMPAPGRLDTHPRADASYLAWYGDQTPVMVVTAYRQAEQFAQPQAYRQYWIKRGGRWRVLFDVPVPLSDSPANRVLSEASD